MKKIFFLLTLSLNFFFLKGQSTLPGGFLKGYILTKTDTIHCYVLNKDFFKNCEVVKYKFSKDDKVQEVYIENIIEVRDNSLLYKKLTFNGKSFLAIQHIKGPVSLYELNYTYQISGFHYNAQYNSNGVYFLEKSNKLIKVERDGYKDYVKMILTDDPETTKKIDESLQKYKDVPVYIKLLVNNYNTWLNSKAN